MGEWSPKIVAFLCTWCSYAGADLAGTGRNQYPPNIRVIRIPCSGRINPIYIIKALLEGADGVMVSGCHPGDCHYLVGNYYARRRFVVLKKLLTAAGFEPDRVHFTWVSASEGVRFSEVVKKVTDKVSTLGPSLIGEAGFIGGTDFTGEDDFTGEASDGCAESDSRTVSDGCAESDSRTVSDGCAESDSRNNSFEGEKHQNELRALCKKLLENGTVSTVIGFQEGGETGSSIPCILDSPEDTDKLVWNDRCVSNLSGYLLERTGKTAIVAKPCDARAIVSLIIENQLKREDIYIIGLVCEGMKNDDGLMLHGCLDCKVHVPPVYDVLIGEAEAVVSDRSNDNPDKSEISFERFVSEMDKCILCFSCRQSCYGCYCATCFMERGEPDWQTTSPDMGAKMLYHLGRSTHLSGRCVECGACENACASGVDIRYLINTVTDFVEDTYGFQAGMDLETEPVMLTYKTDDLEIGFLDSLDSTGGDGGV